MIRHYFPGGNTSKGFFSYYDYIMGQEEANKIYIFKGGPGTGKSTTMKHIGAWAETEGFSVDYLHCSSDPNSLDGLIIVDLNIAMIDGTAPHIVDPKNPGAVDTIIHLGEFWNQDAIRQHKNDIIAYNKKIKANFQRAYKYLGAAKSLFDDICDIYTQATDYCSLNRYIENIIENKIKIPDTQMTLGKNRKLFITAITPSGIINYINTLVSGYNVNVIKSEWGMGGNYILSELTEAAIKAGYDVETFYNPMEPDKYIEHLIIKELKLAFITQNKYNSIIITPIQVIDMTDFISAEKIKLDHKTLKFDKTNMNSYIEKAIDCIKEAKATHDLLEQYYIPYMNFDEIKKKEEYIINDIKDLCL